MQRLLLSLAVVVAVGGGVIASTGAFFSDSETSTGNSFTAGAIDLKVDSTQHYDGLICAPNISDQQISGHHWVQDPNAPTTSRPELLNTPCSGTWTLKDLIPGTDKFFNFTDVKPGDSGENTISLHIDNNPAYACADVTNILNNDNGINAPEAAAGDTTATDPGAGELGQNLDFLIWNDNGAGTTTINGVPTPNAGNNIWDANEVGTHSHGAPLTPQSYTLADSSSTPIAPTGTSYLGFAWCAGTFTAGGPGVKPVCDGSTLGNIVQTDSYSADIGLRVVQARNNGNFKCGAPVTASSTLVGANFSLYTAPAAQACTVTVSGTSIQTAINAASAGNTICVAPGTYVGGLNVNKSITLASTGGPGVTTITGGVDVNADNVTVKGFKVTPGAIGVGPTTASFFVEDVANNANVTDNDIDGTGVVNAGGTRGVILAEGGSFNNVLIQNNKIHDFTSDIYVSTITQLGSSDPVTVKWNDIKVDNPADNGAGAAAGIGQLNDAVVTLNEFTSEVAGGEAIGAGPDYEASNVINFNNFLSGSKINNYSAPSSIQAPNNFFNVSAATQAPSNVTTTPVAGAQYGHR